MTQTEYDSTPLKEYLRVHPKASNDELYSLCNATTPAQKGYVRKKKSRILSRKVTQNHASDLGPITSITPESVERIIIKRINGELGHISDSVVRSTVDFLIKVKLGESEQMEQLDMEQFIYDSTKQEGSS